MAKAEVTAPAMHTILHDKKRGILKGQFQKIFCKKMKMAKAEVTAPAMHTILHDKKRGS